MKSAPAGRCEIARSFPYSLMPAVSRLQRKVESNEPPAKSDAVLVRHPQGGPLIDTGFGRNIKQSLTLRLSQICAIARCSSAGLPGAVRPFLLFTVIQTLRAGQGAPGGPSS